MMMPLKSKAQERYLWANDPQLAKKYEEETGAQARGMVVQCNAGVGLSGGPSLDTHQLLFAGATMAVAGFLWYTDQKISSVTLGIVGAYSLIA